MLLLSTDNLLYIGFGLRVLFYHKAHSSTAAECRILNLVSGLRRTVENCFLLVTQFGSVTFPSWKRQRKLYSVLSQYPLISIMRVVPQVPLVKQSHPSSTFGVNVSIF